MAAESRVGARPLAPRAAFLARPLEHVEVAAARRISARHLVPRAAVLARPLEHLEVAVARRIRARPLVPRAAFLARPLEHLEMAGARRIGARILVPRAAARARPLQQPQVTPVSRMAAQASKPLGPQPLARVRGLERDGVVCRAARPTEAEQVRHLLHFVVDDRADVGVEEDRGGPVPPARLGACSFVVAASARTHVAAARGRAPTHRRRVGARRQTSSGAWRGRRPLAEVGPGCTARPDSNATEQDSWRLTARRRGGVQWEVAYGGENGPFTIHPLVRHTHTHTRTL